jgi:hypothetical protein
VATSDIRTLNSLTTHYNYKEVLPLSDINGSTALHLAVRKGDRQMVYYLLSTFPEIGQNIDAREKKCVGGYAPLHHSCLNGDKEVTKLLLMAGADVNIQADSSLGETPLHICCKHGYIECAKSLIEDGQYQVNMDARDAFGHNASFWAYSKRYEDMIRILSLPPVHTCTAAEYMTIMMNRNGGKFALPSQKKKKVAGKKGAKKKKEAVLGQVGWGDVSVYLVALGEGSQ